MSLFGVNNTNRLIQWCTLEINQITWSRDSCTWPRAIYENVYLKVMRYQHAVIIILYTQLGGNIA